MSPHVAIEHLLGAELPETSEPHAATAAEKVDAVSVAKKGACRFH